MTVAPAASRPNCAAGDERPRGCPSRVLIITHYLGDAHPHGIERVVTTLAHGLRERGDEVTFATTLDPWPEHEGGRAARLSPDGFPIVSVSAGEISEIGLPTADAPWRDALNALLAEVDPDVVHIALLHGLHPDAVSLIRERDIPVVLDCHSYEVGCPRLLRLDVDGRPCDGPLGGERCAQRCYRDRPSARADVAERNRLYARAVHQASARIACSHSVARWIAEQSGCGDIEVVSPPVEATTRRGPRPSADGASAPPAPLRVATIGGVGRPKGSDVVVQGVIDAGLGPGELRMLGPVLDRDLLAELVVRTAAEGILLRATGTFAPGELDTLLDGIDVLVVASQSPETFSIAAREAWSRGIPVLASALGALVDAVEDGVNGFLFHHGDPDALARLLRRLDEDRELLRRLGEGARAVSIPSAGDHLAAVRGIYQRLVPANAGAAVTSAAPVDSGAEESAPEPIPDPPDGVLAGASHRAVFTHIYDTQFWRRGGDSDSGPGSRLAATGRLRVELPALLSRLRVRRLLDLGCGDFNWMAQTALELELYVGVDTVFDVILGNRLRYGGPRRQFLMRDVTRDPLPRTDLVLCRDVLIHFPDADLIRAMSAIADSGARYLLASTFVNRTRNAPIALGDWRPVNLELAPLWLPRPIDVIVETPPERGYDDKRLGLWDLRQVRDRLAHRRAGDRPSAAGVRGSRRGTT